MSLYNKINDRIIVCMKSGAKEERDVLRTLLGEIQAKGVVTGKEMSDEVVEKTLNIFRDNAVQCTWSGQGDHKVIATDQADQDREDKIDREIAIYDKFLPTYETVESIVELLQSDVERLKAAKASGPATGMAMGILKKAGKKIQGKDVKVAVESIRGEE